MNMSLNLACESEQRFVILCLKVLPRARGQRREQMTVIKIAYYDNIYGYIALPSPQSESKFYINTSTIFAVSSARLNLLLLAGLSE